LIERGERVMMMKILGIVGSKRKRGNTSILVETLLKAAETQGAQTEQLFLISGDGSVCKKLMSKFMTLHGYRHARGRRVSGNGDDSPKGPKTRYPSSALAP